MYVLTLLDGAGLTAPDGHRVQSVTAQPKRFVILALLALAPDGRMRRSRIAGLLWPGVGPDRARGSLRTALYGLRRSLGADVVQSEGDGDLVLRDGAVSCDVAELRAHVAAGRTRAALALYRGPLLNGFSIADCPELEREIERHRTRLEAEVVQAGLEAADAALAAAAADHVVALTAGLREIRPLDEQVMRLRIAGLAAQGNQARAASEAAGFRATLMEELGVEPSARTEAAFAELVARVGAGEETAAGTVTGGDVNAVDSRRATPPEEAAASRSAGRGDPTAGRSRRRRALVAGGLALAGLAALAIVASRPGTLPILADSDPMAAGEVALRQGRYATAVEEFRDAIRADTASGRAYYKLAVAAEWAGMPDVARASVAAARARDGTLSERERPLLAALETYLRGEVAAAREAYRSLVRSDPEALDAWAQLAEIDFHWGPLLGIPAERARPAFERLLAVDPYNGEAVLHLARLDARRGDRSALERRTRALLEQPLSVIQAAEVRQLRRLHGLEVGGNAAMAAPPSRALIAGMLTLAPPGDVLDMIDAVGGEAPVGDWLWTHLARAVVEASRGRWTAVRTALDSAEALVPARAAEFRAALSLPPGTPPIDDGTRDFIDAVEAQPLIGPGLPHLAAPTIFASRRAFLLAFFDRVPAGDPRPSRADGMNYMNSELLADYERVRLCHRELAEGNPRGALDHLGAAEPPAHGQLPTLLDYPEALGRWCRADALRRAGDAGEALRWFETFPHPRGHDLAWLPAALLRRAEIHERRGEADAARSLYARLAERLADADGPSVRLRDEARTALARLESGR